jgi:hypothetical protein
VPPTTCWTGCAPFNFGRRERERQEEKKKEEESKRKQQKNREKSIFYLDMFSKKNSRYFYCVKCEAAIEETVYIEKF